MINIKPSLVKHVFLFSAGVVIGFLFLFVIPFYRFSKKFEGRIYPGVYVNNSNFSAKTIDEAQKLFDQKNLPFKEVSITFFYKDKIATISGENINLRLDGKLSTNQAFSMGRAGNSASDFLFKLRSFFASTFGSNKPLVVLSAMITYDVEPIDEALVYLKEQIDVKPVNPLFEIDKSNNKVTAFKLGKDGLEMKLVEAKEKLEEEIESLGYNHRFKNDIAIALPVYVIGPKIKESEAMDLGIDSLIGTGYSFYKGSISGRIYNLTLASSILHGQLIAPGETFSFNDAVGDISAATGYKSAYIIKSGRTVLGDGGGVCQVSTTLFRAVLNAGLPVVERSAHSYRVFYYEQGDFKPGLDATVFAPSTDLKFRNDFEGYILIQTYVIPKEFKLVFEIYGKDDGRKEQILNHRVWDQRPPPDPLYQDDPTLSKGTVKQIDWASWGAKTSFDYEVVRGEEVLFQKTFYSNFQPWQAVFLRGTKE